MEIFLVILFMLILGFFLSKHKLGQKFLNLLAPPDIRDNSGPNMADPKNQMDAISAVQFETCRLLNREESRLLPVLERAARSINQGHRVMAQTSLGEVLRPKRGGTTQEAQRRAFASINSKRLDFAVFNRSGILVCAIEYQGSGHYHSSTFMRDAVKREALRKAEVPFLEVMPDFVPEELAGQLIKTIGPARPNNGSGQ
ncbi:DUF2726 domain-containing protein [Profundibacter sp.]